jgi:hypothetical protein
VLGHRLLLTPFFVAETRELTRDDALAQIRARCLERAPRPRPDWERPRDAPQPVEGAAAE